MARYQKQRNERMALIDFRKLQPGDRIIVARYAITGYRPCVDEETGEPGTRAVMRQVGQDAGTITKVNDGEMVTVRFDQPVPDISAPNRAAYVWSVYFRDVIAPGVSRA